MRQKSPLNALALLIRNGPRHGTLARLGDQKRSICTVTGQSVLQPSANVKAVRKEIERILQRCEAIALFGFTLVDWWLRSAETRALRVAFSAPASNQ